jgi:hypothetical protein
LGLGFLGIDKQIGRETGHFAPFFIGRTELFTAEDPEDEEKEKSKPRPSCENGVWGTRIRDQSKTAPVNGEACGT